MIETAHPMVDIVIPNWNGKDMLATCLESLARQTCQKFSVTVIDNGSTDGSPLFIREKYPSVKLITFQENRGFSFAVNEGIKVATSQWVFLLNNDIEVHKDCLAHVINFIENNKEYDSLAVKMLDFYQRDYIDGAGDAVMRGGAGYRLGTMERDSERYSISREIFGACAGAALYSKRFFEQAGLFDNDFFAYLEDVDLNFRARHRGLRCFYLSEAVVYHIGSATTGSKINSFTIRQSTKNSFHVLTKNYPFSLFMRFLPVIIVYQSLWFIFCVKKMKVVAYFSGILFALVETPLMLKKRKENLSFAGLISTNDFAQMLTCSENEVVESIMSRRDSVNKNNWLLTLYKKLFI